MTTNLEQQLSEMKSQLADLKAQEEIRDLIAAYARVCDTGFNGDQMAELFADDGIWEGNVGILLKGKKEIADFFRSQGEECIFAMHYYTNIRTQIDGDKATGRCLLIQARTNVDEAGGGTGMWMTGDYVNDYVRTDAGWRFSHLRLNVRILSDVTKDWGLAPLANPTIG